MDRQVERIAVAVVRAWIERASPSGLLVRIVRTSTEDGCAETIGVTTDPAEAGRLVEVWLRGFVRESDEGGPGEDERPASPGSADATRPWSEPS